ncbi:hypothetical protein TNCV_3025791 [Trichonephila clavipes]|nr:hypothetical protein TNCV_3025791 [Trichonephila clavipes]
MEAKRNLCEVFREKAVTTRTGQKWLVKDCLNGFSLEDEPRSRRSLDLSDEELRSVIRRNPTLTCIEVNFRLEIYQTIALDYIKSLGFCVQTICLCTTRVMRKKFNGQNFDILFKSFPSQKKKFVEHLMTEDEK